MTLRQSETMLRALVALALGIGFVGFATRSHSPRSVLQTAAAAVTPIADVSHRGGI